MIQNNLIMKLFDEYEEYKKDTLNGKYGKTPRYYMMYVKLIEHFLMLSLSIRTGDFDLFMYSLPKIANVFFIFNQQNYSRYLVKYNDNLLKVNDTHPGLLEEFKKGSFGIKRTDNSCYRQPVDITLEQTINADAANKLTGISYCTNSERVRQRWCKGHSIRTKIISHVMEETGLRTKQDVTADLHNNRIKKSSVQLEKLIQIIKEGVNPFDSTLDKDLLFNISNGQSADDQVADFLLSVDKKGEELRNRFINECAEDKDRFDRSLKMNKINNFRLLQSKKKVKDSGKLVEVRLQRDLFGQLLVIALDKQLDIEKVLSYPLTPIPFSLCHLDGSICKTEKSSLLKLLEHEIHSNSTPKANVQIYDGFFFLHLMKEIPATYENISVKLLQMFLRNDAQFVIIVFDTYKSPSIKDKEHALRGTSRGRKIEIRGPSMRPSDFSAELKNMTFKEDLVEYLLASWGRKEMASFFGNKIVYVNQNECHRYQVINDDVVKTMEHSQSCSSHEEADTKMIYHVCNFEELQPPYNITIRCSDTDILVIMLGNMKYVVPEQVEVLMEVGVGKSQRSINLSELYKSLGANLCDSLPAFHALTGCDFNPAFFRKGKKRPFNLLRNSEKYVDALTNLSKYPDCENAVFESVEEFVCRIYGYKKINKINESRSAMFLKAYKIINDKMFRQNVKSFDASALPPCQSELREHILRTAYIAKIWKNAHIKKPSTLSPLDCGWKVDENAKYDFNWFSGDQVPQSIDDVTNNQQNVKDSDTEMLEDESAEIFSNLDWLNNEYDDDDEDSDYDLEGDEELNASGDEQQE